MPYPAYCTCVNVFPGDVNVHPWLKPAWLRFSSRHLFSTHTLFFFESTNLMLPTISVRTSSHTRIALLLCASTCPHCASLGSRFTTLSSFPQLLLSNQVVLVMLYNGDKIAHKSNFQREGRGLFCSQFMGTIPHGSRGLRRHLVRLHLQLSSRE